MADYAEEEEEVGEVQVGSSLLLLSRSLQLLSANFVEISPGRCDMARLRNLVVRSGEFSANKLFA